MVLAMPTLDLATDPNKVLLESHSMFAKASAETLDKILAAGRPLLAEKNKLLFLQDDPAEYFYLVVSGWVKLFRETLDGDEAVIDVVNTGHLVGASAVVDDGQHSASATVVATSNLISFPVRVLEDAMTQDPALALGMLTSIAKQRRKQSREIEGLTLQNASQRIGCFLLRLLPATAEGSHTLHLPYDKSLIAARLGMKSETFSRGLARLRKDADIGVKGASVTISDVYFLANYVCSACSNDFPCEDLR